MGAIGSIQSGSDSTGTNPPPSPPSAIAPRLVTALTCWIVLNAAAAARPAVSTSPANAAAISTTAIQEPATRRSRKATPKPNNTPCWAPTSSAGTASLPLSSPRPDTPAARSRGHVRQPCSRKIAKPTTAMANDANTHAMPGTVCDEPATPG